MNDPIMEVIVSIRQEYGYNVKTEYYSGASWVRFHIKDRHYFLQEIHKLSRIIFEHGLSFDLDVGWEWKSVEFGGLTFKNPTRTYELFVSTSSKSKNIPDKIERISDSTDPLYDLSPMHLLSAYNHMKDYKYYSYSTCLTNFGFTIAVETKKAAKQLYDDNPFNRVLSITYDGRYYINVYMNDKVPAFIDTLNFKYTRSRKKLPTTA